MVNNPRKAYLCKDENCEIIFVGIEFDQIGDLRLLTRRVGRESVNNRAPESAHGIDFWRGQKLILPRTSPIGRLVVCQNEISQFS